MQTPLTEILRSVPKSCREMIQDGEHSHRNIPYGRLCHQAATELTEKANEVARLRELLNRAIEIAKITTEYIEDPDRRKHYRSEIRQLAPAPEEPCKHETQNLMLLGSHWHWCSRCGSAQRLVDGKPFGNWQVPDKDAPAPEEPVTEKDTKVSVKEPVSKRLCKDCGQPHSKHTLHPYETICPEPVSECHHPDIKGWCHACSTYTGYEEPAPEWREFTIHQEYPQAGDEWRHGSCNPSVWWKVHGGENYFDQSTRFRTLRPLPVQEEPMSIPQFSYAEGSPQTDYSNGVFPSSEYWTKPKQEELPLEKELDYLTREASRASDIHNHVLIVDCLRYLRDEIQKLKATVNKTTSNS